MQFGHREGNSFCQLFLSGQDYRRISVLSKAQKRRGEYWQKLRWPVINCSVRLIDPNGLATAEAKEVWAV